MADPLNILVIEDRNADFLMVERHLGKSGLEARCSRVDSLEGLKEAIDREHWDLVLSDDHLPKLDFHESLTLLQTALPDVPVVMVTGTLGEERAVDLLKLGVRDFVLKENLTRLVPAIQQSVCHRVFNDPPRDEVCDNCPPGKPWQDGLVAAAPRGGTETILLAEDDPAVRKLTTMVLGHYGYRVIEAVDGQDVIDRFLEFKDSIDLVLLDLVMPKKNGKAAFDEMKQVRPDLKAIFTSGYARDVLTENDQLDGYTDFIQKPVYPDDLVAKVREMLDRI